MSNIPHQNKLGKFPFENISQYLIRKSPSENIPHENLGKLPIANILHHTLREIANIKHTANAEPWRLATRIIVPH